jgi:nucleoside phosphorylase
MGDSSELTRPLNLVVALPSEARPIIDYFSLMQRASDPFGLYADADEKVWLTLSGVGKTKSEAATEYLADMSNSAGDAVWLNIGIAGHNDLSVGTCVIAHTVVDAITGLAKDLLFPVQPPIKTVTVKTVEKAIEDYPDGYVYDMEAAGFISSALNHSPAEQIQIIKVISDNRLNPTSAISRNFVSRIIAEALPQIDHLIQVFFCNREEKNLAPSG